MQEKRRHRMVQNTILLLFVKSVTADHMYVIIRYLSVFPYMVGRYLTSFLTNVLTAFVLM